MSTRSNIGVLNADGTVTSVYCQFDGYPSHHGAILLGAYATEDRVRALLALGSLRTLGRHVGADAELLLAADAARRLSDDETLDVCFAYHRDREEPWENVKPACHTSVGAFERAADNDYAYLFVRRGWVWRRWTGPWLPLTKLAVATNGGDLVAEVPS